MYVQKIRFKHKDLNSLTKEEVSSAIGAHVSNEYTNAMYEVSALKQVSYSSDIVDGEYVITRLWISKEACDQFFMNNAEYVAANQSALLAAGWTFSEEFESM